MRNFYSTLMTSEVVNENVQSELASNNDCDTPPGHPQQNLKTSIMFTSAVNILFFQKEINPLYVMNVY
jgi:hypothetical protein